MKKRIISIVFLVLILILFISCFVCITTIKTEDESIYEQPMTIGVEIISDQTVAPTVKATTAPTIAETVKPTIHPTTAPTEKPTEAIAETKPFEYEVASPDFDEDSTEYLLYDTPENNPDGINLRYTGVYLLDIDDPDFTYAPQAVRLSDSERELAANIIMREFGNEGYIACCLQAQALRDAIIYTGTSLESVYHDYQYDRYSFIYAPNQDCYDAIDYIFDLGGLAVPHRILVMYNSMYTTSSWHESQKFVVEYKGVRFFDM